MGRRVLDRPLDETRLPAPAPGRPRAPSPPPARGSGSTESPSPPPKLVPGRRTLASSAFQASCRQRSNRREQLPDQRRRTAPPGGDGVPVARLGLAWRRSRASRRSAGVCAAPSARSRDSQLGDQAEVELCVTTSASGRRGIPSAPVAGSGLRKPFDIERIAVGRRYPDQGRIRRRCRENRYPFVVAVRISRLGWNRSARRTRAEGRGVSTPSTFGRIKQPCVPWRSPSRRRPIFSSR